MPKGEIHLEFDRPTEEMFARARELSGLDFLQAIASGELPPAPMAVTLGFRLAEATEGRAVFEGEPTERVYNPLGMVHGGFAMTLIDSATGCAVQTLLPAGTSYGTIETKANLTRTILRDTGVLTCEAKVVHAGGRVMTAEARVTGADGKLYAHGTSTCLIIPPK
jgi:uncharacterized protein (TIGR00369 family)